jgi:hypothetical protein
MGAIWQFVTNNQELFWLGAVVVVVVIFFKLLLGREDEDDLLKDPGTAYVQLPSDRYQAE